jgi:hypothetical protein
MGGAGLRGGFEELVQGLVTKPEGIATKLAALTQFRFNRIKAGTRRSENTSQTGMCLVENRGEA